jgi:dTDP-4-dehydrorhamnose reductase
MRILVTGATGLVGSNVIKIARQAYSVDVVASVFARSPAAPWPCATVHMDLEDPDSIVRAVDEAQPDVVIHCGAVRDEDRLEGDHTWGWRLMVTGTEVLAKTCQRRGTKLVFISSCWTFGNRGDPPFVEDSPSCPANYFGLLKTVGETVVRSLCDDFAIARLSGVQGINWSAPEFNLDQSEEGIGFGSLVNHFHYRLSRGLPVAVWSEYFNQLDNPIEASDLADLLLTIATGDFRGIFHTCGRNSVTRLELAQLTADAFGFDRTLVRAATPEEMDADVSHGRLAGKLTAPRDSRLQFARSEGRLGRAYPRLRDGLSRFRGYVEQIQAGNTNRF